MISLFANRRRFCLQCIAIAGSVNCRPSDAHEVKHSSAELLISRLRHFLWQSQHADGSWRSSTYALLQSGQALTPFVLFALLQSDPSTRESPEAKRALQWMRSQLREGVLGISDPEVLEYPVFATAFALRCFHRMNASADQPVIRDLRRFLLAQQFTESSGFRPDHLAFGGWGFGGQHPPGQTGHMDLSHARWVLAALEETEPNTAEPYSYKINAQRFLRLVQKSPDEDRAQPLGDGRFGAKSQFDGGFYFSPIVLAANKGRIQNEANRSHFRSYATATCDGVLALLASGVDQRDPRVDAARKWLESNPDWDYPAGMPKDHPEPWGDAVFFYHQATRAEAYASLEIPGDWAQSLVRRLSALQRHDGSINNDRSSLMKEDDPILCSALALLAAAAANSVTR